MEYEELTSKIIAAAIEVHRDLGPGFLEAVYEKALIVELRRRGIKIEAQREIVILYKGVEVGTHRLDLLVEDLIVIDLKAVKCIESIHFAIIKAHIRAANRPIGLILNFARVTLEVKRVRANSIPGFLASSLNQSPTNGDSATFGYDSTPAI